MANNIYQIQLEPRDYLRDEALASAQVLPGMLVERDSNGKFKPHATAGGVAERLVAVEDVLQGNGITDAYASGALVQANYQRRGNQVYMRLANGETAVIGSKLVSNGDGYLKVATADSSAVVVEEDVLAVAIEAVDMSDSSGADPDGFIKVRII